MNQLAPIIAADDRPIILTIPGVPVGKGRPRFTSAGKFARAYTPAKTRHYEDLIRCIAANEMGDIPPTSEAVSVIVTAYMPIPKSLSKAKRIDAISGVLKPIVRPDADNFAKVLDALNGIVWRDDSQVTDLMVRKRYSDRPRLVITIERGEDYQ